MCAPTKKDFTKDPKEEIPGNQGFRAREASRLCYYASKGRGSSYFGLFPLSGLFGSSFCPKGLLG